MLKSLDQKSGFLIGAAIGSGSSALAAELGGADFLLAISAGRFRNMGAPSIACMLPIRDAQTLTESFASEELLTQCRIPVLLGVNVWGPRFEPGERARSIRRSGFAGAVNFPSCMHYSRPMQQILARAGRGIEREIEQLRAVQEHGLTSLFYCATRTQARLAADAGLDLVCLNLGWNVGGAFGHRSRATIEEVATMARDIGRLIKRINPRTRFLLEGGPIATAQDLRRVAELAPIDGYVGGSTIERIPLEASVADQISRFRQASRRRPALGNEDARLLAWSKKFGFVGRCGPQIAFLRRLRALAAASEPVLLLTEPGIDPDPAVIALNNPGRQTRDRRLQQVDTALDVPPKQVSQLLFGTRTATAKQPPLLVDRGVDLLAIRAPERLTPAAQRRLARALREGVLRVPGTAKTSPLGPRIVLIVQGAATGAGALEADLERALAGRTLRMPPLRERRDDLFAIIEHLSASAIGVNPRRSSFSPAALRLLHSHPWPGNEAELRALLGSLAGRSWRDPVQAHEVEPLLDRRSVRPAGAHTEKDRIVDALWRHGFNRTRTAEDLGMSRKTLYNKMRRFGLSG